MAHSEGTSGGGYGTSPHMKVVAWSILVMGISLAVVIILWAWFGYIGPKYSDQVLREQQNTLRQQYGLPPAPSISADEAMIPPSERGLVAPPSPQSSSTSGN